LHSYGGVNADRFYTLVEECLGGGCHQGTLAVDEAARTAHIILGMLGRRLSHDQRLHIAASLPRRLAVELMSASGQPDPDPVAHVACELQIDPQLAARRIRCVMEVVRELTGARHLDALGAGDLS
jgi:hypothetical protein